MQILALVFADGFQKRSEEAAFHRPYLNDVCNGIS